MSEEKYEYRIRKLTPLESFRLMGVTDEDANKMLAVNSNSQCYKQAGNSIVVDVLEAMMRNLFPECMQIENGKLENVWNDNAMNPPEVENG